MVSPSEFSNPLEQFSTPSPVKVVPPGGYKARYSVLVRNEDGVEVVLHACMSERFTLPNDVTSAINQAGIITGLYPNPTEIELTGRLATVPHGPNDPILYNFPDMHHRPLDKLATLIDFANSMGTSFTLISGYFGSLTSGKIEVPLVIKNFTFEPGQSRNMIEYTLSLQEVTRLSPTGDPGRHSAAENLGDTKNDPLADIVSMLTGNITQLGTNTR